MGPLLPGRSKAAVSLSPLFPWEPHRLHKSWPCPRSWVTRSLSLSLPSLSFPTWKVEMVATFL